MPIIFADRRITPEQSAYFDAWRGGSAIIVLLGHLVPLYFEGERIFPALAGAAVMAFFGLSGFFIHKSLAKSSRGGTFDWRAYGTARVNRIVPTFLFALLVTWACWAIAPYVFESGTRSFLNPTVREAISLEGFWRTAFLVNGFAGPTVSANGPLWSLTYEVWFYLGAGLLYAALTGQRLAWPVLAAFPFLALLDPLFVVWGACWVSGAIISILHAGDRLTLPFKAISLAAAPLPIAGLVAVVAAPDGLVYWATLAFQLLFSVWFASHMAHALTARRLPRAPILADSAGYSYTLYIIHFPLLLLAYGINEAKWMAPIAGAAILLIAWAVGPKVEAIKLVAARPKDFPARA